MQTEKAFKYLYHAFFKKLQFIKVSVALESTSVDIDKIFDILVVSKENRQI